MAEHPAQTGFALVCRQGIFEVILSNDTVMILEEYSIVLTVNASQMAIACDSGNDGAVRSCWSSLLFNAMPWLLRTEQVRVSVRKIIIMRINMVSGKTLAQTTIIIFFSDVVPEVCSS